MDDLDKYKQMGQELIDKLKLRTFPVAVKMILPGKEVSRNALRPQEVFGREIPACMGYTWCRRSGFSFYFSGSDIACKPASVHYFGLEQTEDPEDVFKAWERKARYKKDAAADNNFKPRFLIISQITAEVRVASAHAVSGMP